MSSSDLAAWFALYPELPTYPHESPASLEERQWDYIRQVAQESIFLDKGTPNPADYPADFLDAQQAIRRRRDGAFHVVSKQHIHEQRAREVTAAQQRHHDRATAEAIKALEYQTQQRAYAERRDAELAQRAVDLARYAAEKHDRDEEQRRREYEIWQWQMTFWQRYWELELERLIEEERALQRQSKEREQWEAIMLRRSWLAMQQQAYELKLFEARERARAVARFNRR